MQKVKFINMIILLGMSFFTFECYSESEQDKIEWKYISNNEVTINVILSSEIRIEGIRYWQEKLGKKWILQLKNSSGMKIFHDNNDIEIISESDANELFEELLSIIKLKGDSELDKVQISLGLISTLRKELIFYLKNAAIPLSYKLTSKDRYLSKLITKHLNENAAMQIFCNSVTQIQKACKSNFISMNPIVFNSKYLGSEWGKVRNLNDIGIDINDFWFSVRLKDSE